MREIDYGNRGKTRLVEARIGMTIERYFEDAFSRGLHQHDMARELGVSRTAVSTWLGKLGYKAHIVYRRRRNG